MKDVDQEAFVKAMLRIIEIHNNPGELLHGNLMTGHAFSQLAEGHLQILMSRMKDEANPSKAEDLPAFLAVVRALIQHQLEFALSYGFEIGIAYDQELRNKDLEGLVLKTEVKE